MSFPQQLFQDGLARMIAANKALRESVAIGRLQYSACEWAELHCVIAASPGRMMGKTHFILDNATELDLVVVLNRRFGDHFYRNCKATLTTPRTITSLKARDFETIYVDDAEYVFREIDRRALIGRLAGEHDSTFVFLG